MVKIETGKTYAPSRLKKLNKPGPSAGFSIGDDDGDATSSALGAPQSAGEISSLSQLMQIQEVSERNHEERRALASGEAILESLEKLQNEILTGTISRASLEHIVTVTNNLPAQISDANLKQVVAEIKQRAMIEIAKIEMSQ